MENIRILFIEDDKIDRMAFERLVKDENLSYDYDIAGSVSETKRILDSKQFDIVIADYLLGDGTAFDILNLIKDTPIIIVTRNGDEEIAIKAMKRGTYDYLIKDPERNYLKVLPITIERAIKSKESEKQFGMLSHAIMNINDSIYITDMDDRIVFVNKAFCKTYGYEQEDIIGMGSYILWKGAYKNEDVKSIFSQTIEDGKDEFYHRRKDGTEFPVSLSRSVIKDKNGKQVAVVGITHDVTEYKRVHAEIQRLNAELEERIIERTVQLEAANKRLKNEITERKMSEEKIREQVELLNKAQDAILVRDLEDRILFCNERTLHLFGLDGLVNEPEELIGKTAGEVLYKQDSSQLEEAKRITLEKCKWNGELSQITKDGKEVIVESRWSLLRDSKGNPKSILTINTDTTDKKKLESQFLRAQRMESIGTLAGGIAHDLNNMLHPIIMSLQWLQQRFTDEQSQRVLNTLATSAQRGADLVKQVLSFARGLEGERIPIQVRHLIPEMEKILQETFPKSIEISTDIPKDLWTIYGDPTQLHQVIMNLCVNARDAISGSGRLSISAENIFIDENYARINIDAKVGLYVVITVSDTGVGIPPKIMDRIFEPFFTTKEPGKGTGLGLSTAFGIIRSHSGFINVYSEVGRGTRFRVYLPAIETTEVKKSEDKESELPRGHRELVLVADDEASIREVTRTTLETHGYRVITANDGAEAVALYTQNRGQIRVVLMDMVMPIMDGPAAIRALYKADPEVKIIAVSGLKENDKLAEVSGTDVYPFLTKPYTAEVLLRTLHEVLSAK